MSVNEEEQQEEIEVLGSIFPEEFEMLSEAEKRFKILLAPNPGGEDNHVSVSLTCELPSGYPSDCIPTLTIVVEKGLSTSQADELKALADATATENIGLPSIFTVAEAIKEWLVDNNMPGQDGSMYSEMVRRMQQKDVEQKKQSEKAAIKAAADSEFAGEQDIDPEELERIRKRQAGHQVTLDSFKEWKTKFDQEMLEKAIKENREAAGLSASVTQSEKSIGGDAAPRLFLDPVTGIVMKVDDTRLTGKQFFLSGGGKGGGDSDEYQDEEALILAAEAESINNRTTEGTSTVDGADDDDDDDDEDDEDDEDYVDEGGDDDDDDDDDPDSEADDA